MSKLIRQLLGEHDARFNVGIARLEKAVGNAGVDTKLTADILAMSRLKMVELGLDPKDTTGAELFGALKAKLLDNDEVIRAYLGHPASVDASTAAAISFARKIIGQTDTWAIKSTSLKILFKQNPPKKVMKHFHFSSLDSFIKRMDSGEAMLAARLLESKTWWTKHKKLVSALKSSDFERHTIRAVALTDTRWATLMIAHHTATGKSTIMSKECGVVGVRVTAKPGGHILAIVETLYAINELMLHGSFLKLHFVNPSIGTMLIHAIEEGELIHGSIIGRQIHWRDIQRYFGAMLVSGEEFVAHLDVNDLGWLQVETKLAVTVPELAFWVGTDYIGVSYGEDKIISLNMLDIARSVVADNPHSVMYTNSLVRALKSELMARYMKEPITRALAVKQFDISGVSLENDW